MPDASPGYVKNIIKRSLREIVDPRPSKNDKKKIWEFFESKCAYCGKILHKERKEGHMDHLVSASRGGYNHISNRVLSCALCNEKEKADRPWEDFLSEKCQNKQVRACRKKKILRWQSINKKPALTKSVLYKIGSYYNDIATYYDETILRARKLRNKR